MNIVMAVDMGGDDFIAKPFDPSVLMAKIRAVLRRTYDLGDRVPVIERGGAVLNLNDETVTHDGQRCSSRAMSSAFCRRLWKAAARSSAAKRS